MEYLNVLHLEFPFFIWKKETIRCALGTVSFDKQSSKEEVKWATFCIAVFLAESHKPCQEHMRSVAFADFGYLNCWQNNAYRVLE